MPCISWSGRLRRKSSFHLQQLYGHRMPALDAVSLPRGLGSYSVSLFFLLYPPPSRFLWGWWPYFCTLSLLGNVTMLPALSKEPVISLGWEPPLSFILGTSRVAHKFSLGTWSNRSYLLQDQIFILLSSFWSSKFRMSMIWYLKINTSNVNFIEL